MEYAVFHVLILQTDKAQAAIKVCQLRLGADLNTVIWPLVSVVVDSPLHQIPAQLGATRGGRHDDPADGAFPITGSRGQATLVGLQYIPASTGHMQGILIQVIQIGVETVLFDNKYVLAQL